MEILSGAKQNGFKTCILVVVGRDKTYSNYYKHLCDDLIYLGSFKQLTDTSTIKQLSNKQLIFIPHRYVQVYCDMDKLENNFPVKIFGNKHLLKYESREGKFNQYLLIKKAGITFPQQFSDPSLIDRLVIVKVNEKERNYERSFFFADSFFSYKKESQKMLLSGKITKSDLEKAVIEEYLIGVQVNFNFFNSVVDNRLELLGVDTRRQTNIDGIIRMPYFLQKEYLKFQNPSYIESGHIAVTVKESLLEQAFKIAESLVKAAKIIAHPGIIGPFALQTVITAGPPKEKIITFDLSLRIPGSPGTGFTPYSGYLFGKSLSFGERIAMETKQAIRLKSLNKITT